MNDYRIRQICRQFHRLLNRARTERQLAPLGYDVRLVAIARKHAENMHHWDYFGHINPSGDSPQDRAKQRDYPYGIGENLYRYSLEKYVIESRYTDGQLAMLAFDQLMASTGHRENMLFPAYVTEGVWCIVAGKTFLFVQNLS